MGLNVLCESSMVISLNSPLLALPETEPATFVLIVHICNHWAATTYPKQKEESSWVFKDTLMEDLSNCLANETNYFYVVSPEPFNCTLP